VTPRLRPMSAVARRPLERRSGVAVLLVASLVVACSGGAPAPVTLLPSSASSVPGTSSTAAPVSIAPTGATASPAPSATTTDPARSPVASSDLCAVFSAAELIPFLGADPGPGSIAGPLGTGCRWDAGETDVMIQKVPVDYFEDPYLAEGYHRLEGLGERAYVAPHMFGRITAALTQDAGYVVVASESTDEQMQIELLRLFLERSPGPATLTPPTPPATPVPSLSAPSSVAPVACLVTAEQVTQAAGREMVQSAGACSWTAANAGGGFFEVHLADVPASIFQHIQGDRVQGVGDEAFGDEFGLLYVRVADRAFSVQVLAMSAAGDLPDAADVAIAIARYAVESLRSATRSIAGRFEAVLRRSDG
jgi:hypothetical protein